MALLTAIGLALLAGCVSTVPRPETAPAVVSTGVSTHTPVAQRTTPAPATAPLPTPPAGTATAVAGGAPPANCPHYPLGGFALLWQRVDVGPRLGCARSPAIEVAGTSADLYCGHTVWLKDRRLFIVAEGGHAGFEASPSAPYRLRTCDDCRWSFVADVSGLPADAPLMAWPTFQAQSTAGPPPTPVGTPTDTPAPPGTPPRPTPTATLLPTATPQPAALTGAACAPADIGPVSQSNPYFVARGRHGWLACAAGYAERCRGLARSVETRFDSGALQEFEGGWMFWDGTNTLVLFNDGTWIGW